MHPASNKPVVTHGDLEIGAETLDACRRGDREAFRAVYELYKDKIYSIAFYYFRGDASIACDVTQQVFLKLFTSIAQFRGDSEFSTWLYRLVVNTCTDAARRRKTHLVALDRSVAEARSGRGPHAATPEQDLARVEMTASVKAAVSALPEPFRLAILLRYFEGLSYDEMAEALHCSRGTVASRLSRGHRLLAGMLAAFRT